MDCDDSDPAVSPLRTEDCADGVDDDCNGQVDCADADLTSITLELGDLNDSLSLISARDTLIVPDQAGADVITVSGPLNLTGGFDVAAESVDLGGSITTSGDIQISVLDSAAAGDNLTVPAGVSLQSTGGMIGLRCRSS